MPTRLDAVTHQSFPLQDSERNANRIERVRLPDPVGDFAGTALAGRIESVHDLPFAATECVGERGQDELRTEGKLSGTERNLSESVSVCDRAVKSHRTKCRPQASRFVMLKRGQTHSFPCFFLPRLYPSGVKRPLGYRIVTGLWGVWFAAALVGPATLHACPEHAALTHTAHATSHHEAPPADVPHETESSSQTADADCNCLGDCSSSAVESTRRPAARAPSYIAELKIAFPREVGASGDIRYYDQPFANGPPSAVLTA